MIITFSLFLKQQKTPLKHFTTEVGVKLLRYEDLVLKLVLKLGTMLASEKECRKSLLYVHSFATLEIHADRGTV